MTDASSGAILEALAEVRGEQRKAAIVLGAIDGALVMLLFGLLTALIGGPLGTTVAGFRLGLVLAGIAGVVGFAIQFLRWRGLPAIERFETANPAIREALRTARDTAADGRDDPLARRLYGVVLDRLGTTSSRDLLPWRRIAATLAVIAVLGGATLGLAFVDFGVSGLPTIGGDGGSSDDGPIGGDPPEANAQIQPGSEVIGGASNFTLGDKNVSAILEQFQGGNDEDEEEEEGGTGDPGTEPLEPQAAGYSPTEPIEEAELIRAYTIAMQEANNNE